MFIRLPSDQGRRSFLKQSLAAAIGTSALGRLLAADGDVIELPFENGTRKLVTFPEKRPLILLTHRPPQLETPFSVFNEGIYTPNDAFYVRYHLAGIPISVDTDTFRLSIKGTVKTPLSLSIDDLKTQFEQVDVSAVAQCSGNSRGFSKPRVGGGQLGHGAMGNARWQGVRLKDVLEKAGLSPDTKQISFDGLDTALIPETPDYVKALDAEQVMAGEVLLAHTMNGEPLPMLNGYPLRVIVPGYYATYWVKHVHEITALADPYEGFWVKTAYRIPDTVSGCIEPGTKPNSTIPINQLKIRSFITSHLDGAQVAANQAASVRGIAFDGGEGIREVQFSSDGGQTWRSAELGEDLGKYSFREWKINHTPSERGAAVWMSRAINRIGQTQPMEALWNPAGYLRNVVEPVHLSVA